MFRPREHLDYPHKTMYQMIEDITHQYPDEPALEFYGSKTDFKTFLSKIDRAAKALHLSGIRAGDAVTICMPNTPQALECFYAINRLAAVANMVHPLSAEEELVFYLKISRSRMVLTPDLFYEKVKKAVMKVDPSIRIVVVRIQSELNPFLKAAYIVKKGKDFLKFPDRVNDILWTRLVKTGNADIELPPITFDMNRTAVILYSGGTSGTPKGICLSDYNLNCCAMQGRESIGFEFRKGLSMLSCMPMFHGFGIGMNLHLVLMHGACCILMPTFTNESYAKMLVKRKPSFIAGVPTIFEALLHIPQLDNADLSSLIGVFCGGDSLSVELKRKVDSFLHDHGADIQIREGYGLTECVTASCLTPYDVYKEGSIGLPFPDMTYCIVKPGTDEEVDRGVEGEIIISGPSLMLGYLNNEEETRQAIRVLADGKRWLYTGDLGYMDEEGYVYYKQRIKRIIITKGYNVYPGQIENAIDSCENVAYSCVIGVKDKIRMQKVKAFVVLKDGIEPDDSQKELIMTEIKKKVALYALPKEIEFRSELPKTLVGKVAYRRLEEEEEAKASK